MKQMRIHPVVGIIHRLPPEPITVGGQFAGRPLGSVRSGEMILKIAERVHDAARIFFTKAAKRPIGAARIVGEYGLQTWWMLLRRVELLGRVGDDSDHADVAVTPGLPGDPRDEI